MPPRDWQFRVEDMLEAASRIRQYTQGLTFETFSRNTLVVDAVVRNFENIGEAARHVPDDIQVRHPEVPWSDMRDIRNILAHQYFEISARILWETASEDLPRLAPLLRNLLEIERDSGDK